ncbi:hypothetical protein ABTK20_21820, partial [Acinetobacter baumannii]
MVRGRAARGMDGTEEARRCWRTRRSETSQAAPASPIESGMHCTEPGYAKQLLKNRMLIRISNKKGGQN